MEKRTPEQTRDLILINIIATKTPDQWLLFTLILGIQVALAEPSLARAIVEVSTIANSEEERVAAGAGIEQSIAELRDGTEI